MLQLYFRTDPQIRVYAIVPCIHEGLRLSEKREGTAQIKKQLSVWLNCFCCDPGGTRTLDPMIKSHLLYQLSYGVM